MLLLFVQTACSLSDSECGFLLLTVLVQTFVARPITFLVHLEIVAVHQQTPSLVFVKCFIVEYLIISIPLEQKV
jgi:hypothetical protein